jgi:AraC-like DNA-binding protein
MLGACIANTSGCFPCPVGFHQEQFQFIEVMPMNKQDHLALRLARLKGCEELEQKKEALIFLFAKGGIGKFTSNRAIHRLSSGDVLVFNGAEGSKLCVFDNKSEFLFWTFSVCFENLLPLFDGMEISLLHNITDGFKGAKIYPASGALALECQRLLQAVPPQFDLDHRGQIIRIAATILSLEFKEELSKRTGHYGAEDHMVQVFEKLSASELINLSVGELARRFSCSRRHLNRLFHQHFGVSVASLRMEMRLLKALSLLRDANAKIINVAEQCGFNHLGLFNTCFKRRFGTSPGRWRKSTTIAGVKAANPLPHKFESNPSCPLLGTGQCPLGDEARLASRAVMTTIASKITEGANILEDLKRRDLLFGCQATQTNHGKLAEARPGE